MTSASKRPLWRGQGTQRAYRPPSKNKALGKRRWIATLFLSTLVVAFGIIAWQWLTYREPKTHLISILGNQGQSQGFSLDNLSIPPLRFASAYPMEIEKVQGAKDVMLEAPISLDVVALAEKVDSIAKNSLLKDTLFCSVQAQCLSINGRPYVIAANFLLPKEKASDSVYQGAIAVGDLLKVFEKFQGTTIVALDAGDVVADIEAFCERNDFLLLLKSTLQTEVDNDRLWVLTSHSPGEISQENLVSGNRLFGNAVAEALLGTIRVPKAKDTKSSWGSDRILSLDELANYVHRRVYADSSKKQSPWLLRGGTGVAQSNKSIWPEATTVRVAKLNREGTLDGIATKPNTAAEPDSKPSASAPAVTPKTTTGQPENSTAITPPPPTDIWLDRWEKFEKSWERPTVPNQKLAWSFSECFPAACREARGKLINDELRDRAGIEPTGERKPPEPPSLSDSEIKHFNNLFQPESKGSRWDPRELKDAQSNAKLIQSVCRGSLNVSEARQLGLRLDALNETPRPQLLRLVQAFTASRNQPLERETLSTTSLSGLPSQLELNRELQAIVDEATRPNTNKPALLESLLLCSMLNAEQRRMVLEAKRNLAKSSSKIEYPTSLPDFPTRWNDPLNSTANSSTKVNTTKLGVSTSKPESSLDNKDLFKLSELVEEALTDDRRIASVSQNDHQNSRLALIPNPPQLQQGWWPEWHQAGRQSNSPLVTPLRLDKNTVQLSLKFSPIPEPSELEIRCSNLDDAIVSMKINGTRLSLPNASLRIPWSYFKENDSQLKIELEAIPGDKPREEKLVFSVSGIRGPKPESIDLDVRIAGKERIEMMVERLTRLDNREQWVEERSQLFGAGFSLQPFAGHETRFRLNITNQSEKVRSMRANIYALPTSRGIPGRLFYKEKFLNQELETDDFIQKVKRTDPPLATSQLIELKPSQSSRLRFDPEPKVDAEGKSEPADKSAAPKPVVPISGSDSSGGIMVVVSDVNDATFTQNFFLEYLPIEPSRYIEASVQVKGEEQDWMIEVYPLYRDENADTFPDMAPTDFQALDVSLFLEPWMGRPPKGELRIKLNPTLPKPAKLSLAVPRESLNEADPYIGIDVQSYPRALSRQVSLGDPDPHQLEPYKSNRPRGEIRSISDSRKTFWVVPPLASSPDKPPEKDFALDPKRPTIFQAPSALIANVALDWTDDRTPGDSQLATIQLGNRQETLFGDRQWTFEVVKSDEEGFTLAARVADHTVNFDSSGVSNQSVYLKVDLIEKVPTKAVEVIFDSTAPRISGFKITKEPMYKGDQGDVVFTVDEAGLSGLAGFQLVVADRNGDEKKEPLRKLAPKSSETERNSTTIPDKFLTDKLEPGVYKIYVTAFDKAGNGPVRSPGASFQIRERPAPATPSNSPQPGVPQITGTINGTVKFGGGGAVSEGTVKLDSIGKSAEIVDGKFTFDEVPLGKFKLTAESVWQGATYAGEVTGEFKEEKDFTRPISMTVKK